MLYLSGPKSRKHAALINSLIFNDSIFLYPKIASYMFMHYYIVLRDSGLLWWIGVPVLLILIMSLYSQFRKRRSTEN
jgi:hypothetical protein